MLYKKLALFLKIVLVHCFQQLQILTCAKTFFLSVTMVLQVPQDGENFSGHMFIGLIVELNDGTKESDHAAVASQLWDCFVVRIAWAKNDKVPNSTWWAKKFAKATGYCLSQWWVFYSLFATPMKDWKFLSFVAQDILTIKQSHNWFAMAVWSYFFCYRSIRKCLKDNFHLVYNTPHSKE